MRPGGPERLPRSHRSGCPGRAEYALADIEPDSRRLFIEFLLFLGLYATHIVFYLRGGFALVQHAVLRFLLAATGALPWRLRSFLDECADREILRRVGAGYMFRHHLLQESLGNAVAPAWSVSAPSSPTP